MEREFGVMLQKIEDLRDDLAQDREARKALYSRVETTNVSVEKLTWRIDALEKTMNSQAPTIAEFLTYKEQVRGAGKLGRVLWMLGGIILSAAAGLVAWVMWAVGLFTK